MPENSGAAEPHHVVMSCADGDDVASSAADAIVSTLAAAVDRHGSATIALSGGSTPRATLELLGERADEVWPSVRIIQVDERFAPERHPDLNRTMIEAALVDPLRLAGRAPGAWLPMPVPDDSDGDPATVVADAEAEMFAVLGNPPRVDLALLGLGTDGHTASLVPGDPVLDARGLVAVTRPYQGRRRLTLTFDALHAAERLIWLVVGEAKQGAMAALLAHDRTIPAGRLRHRSSLIITDTPTGPNS